MKTRYIKPEMKSVKIHKTTIICSSTSLSTSTSVTPTSASTLSRKAYDWDDDEE